MYKAIIRGIAKRVLFWSLNKMFDIIDADKDGKISKKELSLIQKDAQKLVKKIQNARKKAR